MLHINFLLVIMFRLEEHFHMFICQQAQLYLNWLPKVGEELMHKNSSIMSRWKCKLHKVYMVITCHGTLLEINKIHVLWCPSSY
ncbi:hypothetical protein O6H91_15G017000 [Diphasiastrum complanatum]|uniref:Uncharacterized protein n=1 Tax=Diphasiastrum complanatum TaxID=34168 RepID=A0ACC2BGC1_DIPCM|nr:hypothetical protein O6H91_15G017000 [Diphasiastrum complanatum]